MGGMWQLYQFPLCPFSRKVRLLLGEKGIGYDLVRESPWAMRDEFLDLNPAGLTPVMADPDRAAAARTAKAMMGMVKFDIAALKATHAGTA